MGAVIWCTHWRRTATGEGHASKQARRVGDARFGGLRDWGTGGLELAADRRGRSQHMSLDVAGLQQRRGGEGPTKLGGPISRAMAGRPCTHTNPRVRHWNRRGPGLVAQDFGRRAR